MTYDFFLLQAFSTLLVNIPEIRRCVTHAVQKLSLNRMEESVNLSI
jgi:hypothetical protein